jgi:hypothetical protein
VSNDAESYKLVQIVAYLVILVVVQRNLRNQVDVARRVRHLTSDRRSLSPTRPFPATFTMSIDEPDAEGVIVHKYNFPPFPEPLPGRELPPFEKFVSKGIIKPSKPTNPDAPPPVELDGLGIPTVRLHAEHAIGGDVTKKKKKKKKKKTLDVRDENGRQLQWWELWAEDEDERGPGAPYSK